MSRCLVFLSFSRFSSELCVFSSCWESFLSSKNPRKSSKSPKHPLGKFQPDPSLESGPFPFHLPPSLCGPSMQRPISVVSLPASPPSLGRPGPARCRPACSGPSPLHPPPSLNLCSYAIAATIAASPRHGTLSRSYAA